MRPLARIAVIVFFVGLLVTLRALNNLSTPAATAISTGAGPTTAGATGTPADRSLARYGLDLQEVSRSA